MFGAEQLKPLSPCPPPSSNWHPRGNRPGRISARMQQVRSTCTVTFESILGGRAHCGHRMVQLGLQKPHPEGCFGASLAQAMQTVASQQNGRTVKWAGDRMADGIQPPGSKCLQGKQANRSFQKRGGRLHPGRPIPGSRAVR